MKTIATELKTATLLTLVLVVLLCGVYPLAVWAGGQLLFRDQANGSLIVDPDGTVRGSALLAQNFTGARYFHPRPSAAGAGFDAASSSGTNFGPTSAKLAVGIHAKDAAGNPVDDPGNYDGVQDLVQAYRTSNGLPSTAAVPADAVTRSASGLDPHISLANADLQASRVATSRGLSLEQVHAMITTHTDDRDLGVLGEPGVNVVMLNRALDAPADRRSTGQ